MSSDNIDCEFPKSCTHINKINALKTPFEKMVIVILNINIGNIENSFYSNKYGGHGTYKIIEETN